MHNIRSLCTSQNASALGPPCHDRLTTFPRYKLTSAAPCHRGLSCRQPLPLSVNWDLASESYEKKQLKLQIFLASSQSPKQPQPRAQRSFWPTLLSRPLIYSSRISDVDPLQLSELWLQTLRMSRDPMKILKSLRHSFTFVVVLAEDEDAHSTIGSRLKTVGRLPIINFASSHPSVFLALKANGGSDMKRRQNVTRVVVMLPGIGRVVSDGSFIATICDVAVDPAYRYRGIGRRIVKKLVENVKKIGGPTGFAVFPPPLARRFFWMIGFRSDRKYKLMAYRQNLTKAITETQIDGVFTSENEEKALDRE